MSKLDEASIKKVLLRLLYFCLLDMRENASVGSGDDNKNRIFLISDVIHNIPNMLLDAEEGLLTYESVLDDVLVRAERRELLPFIKGICLREYQRLQ